MAISIAVPLCSNQRHQPMRGYQLCDFGELGLTARLGAGYTGFR
jgi:hypothetical protein